MDVQALKTRALTNTCPNGQVKTALMCGLRSSVQSHNVVRAMNTEVV